MKGDITMYLPVMDQFNEDKQFLSRSFLETIFKPYRLSMPFIFIFSFLFLAFTGSVYSAFIATILCFVVFLKVGFLSVVISRYINYKKLVSKIKGRHKLALNSCFKLVYDETKNITIALAYGFEDDFSPTNIAFAEYWINNNSRDCHCYSADPDNVFFTQYGLLIKIIGIDDNKDLEFEIVGLRRLGTLFS